MMPKCSTNKKNNPDDFSELNLLIAEDNAEEIIRALKHDHLSSTEFDTHWKACSKYRINNIKTANTTLEILTKWPEYKLPHGYRFIDIDFGVLFPQASSILTTWETHESSLLEVLYNDGLVVNKDVRDILKDFHTFSQNSKVATLLWATHACLIPWHRTATKDDKGQKHLARFTIRDSQNAFMLLRSSVAELEEELRFKMSKESHIQPFLLLIGKSINDFDEIFVYFDGIRFAFKSIVRAVEICFKTFHLFNLKYPRECTTFWKFIEIFFFKIKSKDNNSSKVNILCNALYNKNENQSPN